MVCGFCCTNRLLATTVFSSWYSEVVFLCKLLGHDDQSVKVRGFVTEKKKGLESSNVPI